MRLAINWDLCIGSGLCAASAPQVFRLVPYQGEVRAVLASAALDDALLLAAARACPTLAIRLTDDAGRPVYPTPAAVRD